MGCLKRALPASILAALLCTILPPATAQVPSASPPQSAPRCLHGRWETDASPGASPVCVCDNAQPGRGEWGWGGPLCDIRIYGAVADGKDMTQGCKDRHCGSLAPEEWMCYDVPFSSSPDPEHWNHLTVQLTRTSDNISGDPDLYGMWYGGSSTHKKLDRATFGYDFRETSSAGHASVVKAVAKSQFNPPAFDYTGVHLCVRAYGQVNVTYAIRATLTLCPADFTPEGAQLICSSPLGGDPSTQRYSECTSAGQCLCTGPYKRPVQDVYENLGFEDCSARVDHIDHFDTVGTTTYVAQEQEVGPKNWRYYSFNVTPEDYQLVVDLSAEAEHNCTDISYIGLFAKFGQPPGLRYGEFDFRPEWVSYSDPVEREKHTQLRFDGSMPGWQTGEWYLGLSGDNSDKGCNVTLAVSKFHCPMDCSGRGSCVEAANGTRACKCDKGFFGIDCTREAAKISFGKNLTQPETTFEYDYYDLPPVTPAMLKHNVEVRIAASFSSGGYGAWSSARPELLLLKGAVLSEPSVNNYTFRQLLQQQNTSYEIDICPSQLKQGSWRVAVYNPMRIYKVAYNLSATKQAKCLNDCSQHGTCSDDGMCHCEGDWAGGDCSVLPGGKCQSGTRRPLYSGDSHGTCWQECHCDESGDCEYDSNNCAAFTCDSPHMRRQGDAHMCVQDACSQDEYEATDDHTCLKACQCPDDGSACTLADTCRADRFECKTGYEKAPGGALSCVYLGCKEGSLQEAVGSGVDNGRVFARCECHGGERGPGPKCAFATGTAGQEGLVVACDSGYREQGGRCLWEAPRGVKPVGVVLWTFFGLLMGLAGGVLAHWYYKRRAAKAMPEALYHELSMDTGF